MEPGQARPSVAFRCHFCDGRDLAAFETVAERDDTVSIADREDGP
jgi:hypothetical protein